MATVQKTLDMKCAYILVLYLTFCNIISRGNEETTEHEYTEYVTESSYKYAYLKGDRRPAENYSSPDEMYRASLKHVLQLFWTEKCHISEVKEQHGKLKTPLDEKILGAFDEVNKLMSDCAEDILNVLRDNITSSERVDPIEQNKFDQIAALFKKVRRHFEENVTAETGTDEMKIIREELRLADEQLQEGYGIVREMIRNTTLPWS